MDYFKDKNIKPMLFYQADPFDSKDYIYEIKFDGFRAIIYIEENLVTIKSRTGEEMSFTILDISKED